MSSSILLRMRPSHKAAKAACGAFIALVASTAGVSAAQAADLCNNTNTGGVLNGPPGVATCNLTAASHITQIVTYHWNNGRGSPGGTITLRNSAQQNFTFPVQTSSGQNNAPNVNWVANVNLNLPAGQYMVLDSDPATRSWNPQVSGQAGFTIIRGDYTAPPPPPPRLQVPTYNPPVNNPPVNNPPVAQPGAYNPLPQGPSCVRNSGAIGDTSPCTGAVRRTNVLITLRLKQAIRQPLGPFVTFHVPGRPSVAIVSSRIVSGGGTAVNSEYSFYATATMCVNTGITYAIQANTAAGQSMGDVGVFVPDCR